jgi:hypothetical protein
LTDIMSIPASVTRRAYQAAEAGGTAGFFYVRHFIGSGGRPDEYVVVTCRLAGGGARVPLSLVDVKLAFAVETPVLFVRSGDELPTLTADITYTGTGRLQGRWRSCSRGRNRRRAWICSPRPRFGRTARDAAPVHRTPALQRAASADRPYRTRRPGSARAPDVRRRSVHGAVAYRGVGRQGSGLESDGVRRRSRRRQRGAVAGFPLPTLRYIVGRSTSEGTAAAVPGRFGLIRPEPGVTGGGSGELEFAWMRARPAAFHRLEIEGSDRRIVHAALVNGDVTVYRAPSWLAERAGDGRTRWRVVALSATGHTLAVSEWRSLRNRTDRSGDRCHRPSGGEGLT